MGIVSVLLLIVFVISAILLIIIVLLQDEQGEGIGGIFGGGNSQIGNRRGNILTKTTSILGTVFLLTSFGLAWLNRTPEVGDIEGAARRLEAQSGPVRWWDEANETALDGEVTIPGDTEPEMSPSSDQ